MDNEDEFIDREVACLAALCYRLLACQDIAKGLNNSAERNMSIALDLDSSSVPAEYNPHHLIVRGIYRVYDADYVGARQDLEVAFRMFEANRSLLYRDHFAEASSIWWMVAASLGRLDFPWWLQHYRHESPHRVPVKMRMMRAVPNRFLARYIVKSWDGFLYK